MLLPVPVRCGFGVCAACITQSVFYTVCNAAITGHTEHSMIAALSLWVLSSFDSSGI